VSIENKNVQTDMFLI